MLWPVSPQLSRVLLKSKTPNWRDAELQYTRLRHPSRGEMLLFKELEWMTTRIEANGLTNVQNLVSTPLRLIANQAKIRIVIKKRLRGENVVDFVSFVFYVIRNS